MPHGGTRFSPSAYTSDELPAAKEYIQKHCSEYILSLDMTVQNIDIHPNYLRLLFKETPNVNFVEYLNKQYIEKADVFLSTTQMAPAQFRETHKLQQLLLQHFSKNTTVYSILPFSL